MKRMKSSGRSSTGSPELVVVLPLINLGKFQKTGSGQYIVSKLRKNQNSSAKRIERKQAKSVFHLSNINQKKEKLTEQDKATLLNLNKKEHTTKRRSKNGHSDFSKKQKRNPEPSFMTRNNQREIKKKKSETQIPLERTNLENRFIIEENKLQVSAYRNAESSAQTGMSRRSPSERKKTKYFGEWLEHAELFSRSQSQKKQDKGVEMDQETNVPVIPNVRGNEVYSWKTMTDKKKKAEYLADLAEEIELIKGTSSKTVDSTKKELSTNEELFTAEKPREREVVMVEKKRMSSASETQECVENKISKEKEEFLMKSGLKPVFKKRKAESIPAALPKPDNKQPKLLDSVCTSKCNLHRSSESTMATHEGNCTPTKSAAISGDSATSSSSSLTKLADGHEALATPEGNCTPSKIAAISGDSATSSSCHLSKLADGHDTVATPEDNGASTKIAAISGDSATSSSCHLSKLADGHDTLATPEGKFVPTKSSAISGDSATSSSSSLSKLAGGHETLATPEGNCVSTTSAVISGNCATSSSSRLTKLADSFHINRIVRRLHKVDLKILHCLLFLCDARKKPIWRSILSFEGFDFDKSSQKYECRKIILRRLGESVVKRIAYIFGLTPLNSTLPLNVLINEIMEFLMNLRENEKEPKNKVLQNAHDFFQSGPRSFKRKKILKGLLFQDAEILDIKEVKSASSKFMNSDVDAQITNEVPVANADENAPFTQAFSSSSETTSGKTRKTGMLCGLMTSGLQIPKQVKEQQVTEKTELCFVTHEDVNEKSATAPADRNINLLRSPEKSAKVVMTHTGEKEQTLLGFADVDGACDKSSTEVKASTDASPLVKTTAPLMYNSQIVKLLPIVNSPNFYMVTGKLISQPIQLPNFIAAESEKKQMTAPTPHRFYNIVLNQSSASMTTQQGHSQTIHLPGFAVPLSTNASTLAASSVSNVSPVLNLKQTTMVLVPEATQHKNPTTYLGPKLAQSRRSATSSATNDVSPVINSVGTLPITRKIIAAINPAITKTIATPTIAQGIIPKSQKDLKFSLSNSDVWNISHDIENDLPLACDKPPEVITIEDSDCDEETEETKQIPTKEGIFASIHDIISLLELEDINEENISRKLVERFPNIVLSDHQEFIKDSIRKIFL